jgi:ATP-dependent DNA helicase RecG
LSSNTDKLRKILQLEQKKGFQNTAVIGGLDKYLKIWVDQIIASNNDSAEIYALKKTFLNPQLYADLDQIHRGEWVKQALEYLDNNDKPMDSHSANKTYNNKKETTAGASKMPAKIQNYSAAINKSAIKLTLESPIILVKGINEVLQKRFNKMEVHTIRDLLYFFPARHIDYSQRTFINKLTIGQENTIIANIWEAHAVQLGSRRSAQATVGDETGNVKIVWFNQPYLARSLKTGSRIVISGKVSIFGGVPVFESPEWELYEEKELVHTGRLVPVYPLTQGLSQRQVRRIIKPAVDRLAGLIDEFLPGELLHRLKLLDLRTAICQAHYPDNEDVKNSARKRLAFDELFLLQLGVMNKKHQWQSNQSGRPINTKRPELQRFIESLPYKLTSGQNKALHDILGDIGRDRPMSRLLQGEVGSGKTVIATAALLLAVADGYQGTMMAPTEILAEQHLTTMRRALSKVGNETGDGLVYSYSGFLPKSINVALLIGDLNMIKKQKLQKRIVSGEIDIAIGTHALIQKDIDFNKLGLVVVDEQHRFGVEQRSALRHKGVNPHMLVMTATPIPRTLALTLYGDLDLSIINELPPGRQTIKTRWLSHEKRATAYNFIKQQVNLGRQAFIICPLVEESESVQAKAAVAEFKQLSQNIFPDLRLGLLHGRMSSRDKDEIMQKFNAGETDILVSTPVVEVGIDVPNATVMMIESADRFGLSQLHQFRGRVGRGTEQSYCILMAERPSEIGKARLDLIEKTCNGFILAEEDLKLRGPGEFFGTRQSGMPDLKMARISDLPLLELARSEAINLYNMDLELTKSDHRKLAQELARVWHNSSNESG